MENWYGMTSIGHGDCRLVVNADDFGLHRAVNQGICRAHLEGVVTSTSLIACGQAFEDALKRLQKCPNLGVGIHLTLVEEQPVTPVEKIPSLVNRDGFMLRTYGSFTQAWLAGRIRERHVRYELEAQIERVLESGIHPSHLDSHQHVHCLPGVWNLTLELAKKYSIPYVRVPAFDSLWAEADNLILPAIRAGVNLMASWRRLASTGPVRFADHARGFSFSGHMTTSRLLGILRTLRPGLTEIMVHPGFSDDDLKRRYGNWGEFSWGTELQALLDPQVLEYCHNGNFALTNFMRVERSKS